MAFKRKLLLISSILFVHFVSAQKITHSLGIGATFSGKDVTERFETGTSIAQYFARLNRIGLSYYPRITLLQNKNSSVSAGAPLMAGVSWATTNEYISYSIISSTFPTGLLPEKNNRPHFAIEIPLVLDYNIGAGSSYKNIKGCGFYLGGGYAYSYTTYTNGGTRTVSSYDPLLRTGIRFPANAHQLFTVGFSYKWTKQFGVQILKDI